MIKGEKIVLDTHILLWYEAGIKLSENQINAIDAASSKGILYICAITFWEVIILSRKKKITFPISITDWIKDTMSIPGLKIVDVSTEILIESCHLPDYQFKDPADRMIIALTRLLNAHLITADQNIINYSKQGYVKTLT